MFETQRTEDELEDQRSEALTQMDEGSRWPGMSYEQGVEATIAWIVGDRDEPPMGDG